MTEGTEKQGKPRIVELGKNFKVGMVSLSEITTRRQNYRRMTPEQRKALEASMRKLGFQAPVIVQEVDGGRYAIIDGHHRVDVARKLGITEIPVVILPKNLSDADLDLAMLSFNITGEIEPEPYLKLLIDLSKEFSLDTLAEFTAIPLDELEAAVSLEGIEETPIDEEEAEKQKPNPRVRNYWKTAGEFVAVLPNTPAVKEALDTIKTTFCVESTNEAVVEAVFYLAKQIRRLEPKPGKGER